jgi:lipoprotein signal peptidase
MAERSYRKLFWTLAAGGLVLDQATKYGVFRWLYNDGHGDRREFVPNVFELVVAPFTNERGEGPLRTWGGELMPQVNHGALFGFLNEHVGLANALFAVISLVAAAAIVWWSARPSARRDLGLSAALGLILAGTLGNLYDRLVFGGVRDFLHLHYYAREWPVFNVADCCLVFGAVLLLGQAFLGKAPAPAPAPQEMAEARS